LSGFQQILPEFRKRFTRVTFDPQTSTFSVRRPLNTLSLPRSRSSHVFTWHWPSGPNCGRLLFLLAGLFCSTWWRTR